MIFLVLAGLDWGQSKLSSGLCDEIGVGLVLKSNSPEKVMSLFCSFISSSVVALEFPVARSEREGFVVSKRHVFL